MQFIYASVPFISVRVIGTFY